MCVGAFTSPVGVRGTNRLSWRAAWCDAFQVHKLPDAFELCHPLFVSNTVFQKMSCLTGVFFSPVVGLQTVQGPWMKVLLLWASIESCPSMRSLFPSGKWQNISPPSIYKCVTLNHGESSFNWTSWKPPSPGPGCHSHTQQGKWCRNRIRWEIFLTFHQQLKVISHRLTQSH